MSIDDPGLHPLADAIGRLITRVSGMELWIFMARSHLSDDCTYVEAEKKNPGPCVTELLGLAGGLPDEERDKLRDGLRIAKEVLDVRNDVVHGVLLPNHDGTELEPQRPDRKLSHTPRHEWPRRRVSRASLLQNVERAAQVSGLIQSNLSRWQELLDLDPEEDGIE